MDPVSLVCTLACALTALQKIYNSYTKLHDAKQGKSIKAFRTAASRLQDDLRMYEKFIKDVLEQPGLASVINDTTTSSYPYWSAFRLAVDNATNNCHHWHLSMEGSDSALKKAQAANELFSKNIDVVTARMTDDTAAIERAYKKFHISCSLHHLSNLRRAPQKLVVDSSPYANSIDNVVSSFGHNPFNLSTRSPPSNIPVEYILKMNENRDVAQRITEIMTEEGASWVKAFELSSSIEDLNRIQNRLMELIWAVCIPQMNSEGQEFSRFMGDERINKADLEQLNLGLKSAIARGKADKFSIAFCGMIKAGKSHFLNALMGRIVLPSDELPSTALPCRLRHVPQKSTPSLEFEPGPFKIGIAKLQEQKFGSKMQHYQPPVDDDINLFDDDAPSLTTSEDLSHIYSYWVNLPKQTRQNLLLFEEPDFELRSPAEGVDEVATLLAQLNDIVRLCHSFRLGFSFDDGEWPLLSVEFESLRNRDVNGIFEFIDLPGLGEKFDDFDFKETIARVTMEANAVVPIISFKEIPKSDWKRLPKIISSGLKTRASMVICTHFDQISMDHLQEQKAHVAQIFWRENPPATHRIIPCSSSIGLSAAVLRRLSAESLPDFDTMFSRKSITYPCASAILGLGKSRKTYETYDLKPWQDAVDRQWRDSGLPNALHRLTSDLVEQAKQRILIDEGDELRTQIQRITRSQRRVLLEVRRSRDELERAREEFYVARAQFTNILSAWSIEERRRDIEYDQKLDSHIKKLQDLGKQCVERALDETAAIMTQGGTPDLIRDELSGDFIWSKQEAEEFLHESQQRLTTRLLELKRQFVTTIRDLAERANKDRVERLRDAIKAFKDDMEAELRSEILVDLESLSFNIRALAFHSIQKGLKTERVRYSAVDIYNIFEGIVGKPFLTQRDDIVDDAAPKVTVKDLGLLIRAPVAVIASVPFVLTVGVLVLVTKTKKYRCALSELGKVYQANIVTPFLNDLQKDGTRSLKSALAQSSEVAKAIVEDALKREDARYERESKEKDNAPLPETVAELIASHLNFLAAEGAFGALKDHLIRHVQYM